MGGKRGVIAIFILPVYSKSIACGKRMFTQKKGPLNITE